MLLSIITINYNNAAGLRRTIESVKQQSNQEFEYLIIDGGSADESQDIIKQNEERIQYWISEKDSGIYDAMNKGIVQSTGNYTMFLNSGDLLNGTNTIDTCLQHIRNYQETDIFYGDICGTTDTSSTTWVHTHPEHLDIFFWQRNNINHQASLIRRSLFTEFGLYPSAYRLAGDHWLFLKSFVSLKHFRRIAVPLVIYSYSGASTTSRILYDFEMQQMWQELVPPYCRDAVAKYTALKYYADKRSVQWLSNAIDRIESAGKKSKKIVTGSKVYSIWRNYRDNRKY